MFIKNHRDSILRLLIVSTIVLFVGAATSFLVRWPLERLLVHGCFIDKAFFYSVIARNFNSTVFLTFDNLQKTNAFHPLWLAVQIILQRVFKHTVPESILAYSSYLTYLLFVGFITFSLRNNYTCLIILSSLILVNPSFFYMVLRGVETPLMLLTLALLLNTITEKDKMTPLRSGLLGIAAGCLFLARTDLFWGPVVCFFWLAGFYKDKDKNENKNKIFNSLLLYSVCCTALVLPYLLFNLYKFNSLIPISAKSKMFYMNLYCPDIWSYIRSGEWCGPSVLFIKIFMKRFLWKTFFRYSTFRAVLPYMVYPLVYFIFLKRLKHLNEKTKVFGIITLFHFLYMVLFYRELMWNTAYYFTPEIVFIVYFLSQFVENLEKYRISMGKKKIVVKFVVFVFCITFCYMKFLNERFLPKSPWWESRLAMARFLKNNLKDEKYIAAVWPGTFSAFSGRNIVPLDGTVNSLDYFENYLKPGKEIDFLKKNNIKYVVVGHRKSWREEGREKDLASTWVVHGYVFLNKPSVNVEVIHKEGFWSLLEVSG